MENNSKIVSAGLIGSLREMNNPLTSIKLCLDLLQTCNEKKREEYYAIIKKNTQQLQNAIQEISESFSKEGLVVNFQSIKDISMNKSSTALPE